jgi:hypothetical protein
MIKGAREQITFCVDLGWGFLVIQDHALFGKASWSYRIGYALACCCIESVVLNGTCRPVCKLCYNTYYQSYSAPQLCRAITYRLRLVLCIRTEWPTFEISNDGW